MTEQRYWMSEARDTKWLDKWRPLVSNQAALDQLYGLFVEQSGYVFGHDVTEDRRGWRTKSPTSKDDRAKNLIDLLGIDDVEWKPINLNKW